MADNAKNKAKETFARVRAELAEAAKKPRPEASSYSDIKDFVEKARENTLPRVEYHKGTDTTLVALNAYNRTLVFPAARLPQFLAEAAADGKPSYAKTIVQQAQAAVESYAGVIAAARDKAEAAAARAGNAPRALKIA